MCVIGLYRDSSPLCWRYCHNIFRGTSNVSTVNNCYYVESWPNSLKRRSFLRLVLEIEYRNRIQYVNPLLGQTPKKTVNIILKAGGYPTGFTPKGEFHRDLFNGQVWTNNLAVRAALLRSEIHSYPLYVFSLTSVLSFSHRPST